MSEIRIATKPPKEEIRSMEVGDVVSFPFETYNPSTVRNTPSQQFEQRMEGNEWITKADYKRGRTIVVRIA